jgi:hypothetical protein
MVCNEMRERLSEYLDGVLTTETKTWMDDHLSECAGCRKELELLKTVVRELHSLHQVDPPEDFLEQIHGRMRWRTWHQRVIRFLFFPLRFKIPIQIAGAITAGLLVFSILTLQQDETDRILRPSLVPAPPPATLSPETGTLSQRPETNRAPIAPTRVGSKEDVEKSHGERKAGPGENFMVDEATGIGATAEKQRVLTLILRIPMKQSSAAQDKDYQKAESENQRFRTKKEAFVDPLVHELKVLAARHQGQMLTAAYDAGTGKLDTAVMEIPSSQYGPFSEDLKVLGAVEPSGSVPKEGEGSVKVRIKVFGSGE